MLPHLAGDFFDQLARAADLADRHRARVLHRRGVGEADFLGDERHGAVRADARAERLARVAIETARHIHGHDVGAALRDRLDDPPERPARRTDGTFAPGRVLRSDATLFTLTESFVMATS